MTRRLPAAEMLDEGGVIVRGTTNIDEALRLVADAYLAEQRRIWTTINDSELATEADDWAWSLGLAPGTWYRRSFCQCGGGHTHDVIPAEPGSRGAFQGLLFGPDYPDRPVATAGGAS